MKKNVVVQAGACLFVVAMVFCSLVIGGSVGYYLLPYANGDKNGSSSSKKTEELPLNNQLVQQLYEIPMSNAISHNSEFGDYLYQKSEFLTNDFSTDVLLAMAYASKEFTPEVSENGSYITGKQLREAYDELFGGNSKEFLNTDFQTGCTSLRYFPTEDNYYIVNNSCASVATSERVNKMIRAVRTNNTIEIYDMVAYIDLENKKIYADSELTQFVADYEESYDLSDYESDLKEYKYTYQLNDDTNYYFYSSELVK